MRPHFFAALLATTALARPSTHAHGHYHAHRYTDLKPIKGEMAALGPGGASDCCQGDMLLVRVPTDWHEELGQKL
ncbi:hypothetical protein B0T11DRAFT_286198 [Plectosphaerella cucumerina]|uniref:Uncharacterized protein n=1 Tax=Plectosphaerella cucumerina TaxID=40658 RepID=A0A8K0TD21_9PEZI|nr:hypothetical protein B0T11DRAFT_286198 [Plectosphaerella cucumerina]